jgi:hypothetical protein
MADHHFYAQPTIFDAWQSQAGKRLQFWWTRLLPFAWVLGFAVLGMLFLASVLLGMATLATSGPGGLPWNQLLPQLLVIIIGLIAALQLFRQMFSAWPVATSLPAWLHKAGRRFGCYMAVQSRPVALSAAVRVERRAVDRCGQGPEVQAFFAGVRAAGVNVAIAKVLFDAGIRSPRQLLRVGDAQLLSIHGVGPATVSKLRTAFRQGEENLQSRVSA